MISATLTVELFKPPVNSIEEIINFPHKLVVSNGSSVHRMFLEATSDSPYAQVLAAGKLTTAKSEKIWVNSALKSKICFLTPPFSFQTFISCRWLL